jgi:hypothetical protein
MDPLSGWGGLGSRRAPRRAARRPARRWPRRRRRCAGGGGPGHDRASPFTTDAACWIECRTGSGDRLLCHVEEMTVAFNLTELRVEDLEQIDPEPLLEQLSVEKQQQFEQKQEQQQIALVQEAERRRTQVPQDTQTVEIAKPDVEIAPDQSRFVADHDNKVEKQTVARGSDLEEIAKRSQAAELEVKEHPREAAVEKPPEPGLRGRNPGHQGQARQHARRASICRRNPQLAHTRASPAAARPGRRRLAPAAAA